ncbi:aromatic amino acid DMT transporter YddG [Achromobacter aloeverae]|uniref:EamA family transporter n=1 Tax=Achromobacter aloeverae TaxID=1750518 RepID=A0A4Q1HPI1_9BURK|nr:aromatic amino acid DMT transporter YddG [Achromobacter aloeverae]RXN92944.1 EamA family transporter [Achromobacter aloeverae]
MPSKQARNHATLIGLSAILLWGAMVGLVRSVTVSLGPALGAAAIYSVGALFLYFAAGWPSLRAFPRRYLYAGSLLFVAYETCLALSLGYAHSGQQAIEVSMVNYLWPSLTVAFAIFFNGQRAGRLVWPGLALALLGVAWAQGSDALALASLAAHVGDNPFSYGLALLGAVLWAAYCTVTTRLAAGRNGITFFFALTALAFWVQAAWYDGGVARVDGTALLHVLLAAGAMGGGYAAWNVGILHGNVTVMAAASYFTPLLSAALAAWVLDAPLSFAFWQGALMVCAGSLLCWHATRRRGPSAG